MNGVDLELARAHAPLFAVTIPLVGAALVLIAGSARLSWVVATVAALIAATVTADFAYRLLNHARPAVAELSIPLQVDGVGSFGAALVTGLSALAIVAVGAFLKDAGSRAAPFRLALLLCITAGWSGALLARDLAGVAVSVEVAWLAGVAVVTFHGARDRAALNGALRMLTLGGVASALTLLGVGLIGRAAGDLRLATLPIAHISMPGVASAGIAFVIVGLAVKATAAPVHAWAAAALGRGGAVAGLWVGAIGVVGALLVMTRLSAYAVAAPELGAGVSATLAVLGGASVVIGSVQAVGARTLPRLATYACISQAGCVLVAIALGSPAGFAAALVQLLALAAAALAMFGGAAVGRIRDLAMLDGFWQRAPLASVAITAGTLSLMGAPMTLGFLGRWRLIEAGVGVGWWWAPLLVIIASLAGVFYGGRLIERIYFRRANRTFEGEASPWRFAVAPSLICAILTIALGLAPAVLLRWSDAAAGMLTGAAT